MPSRLSLKTNIFWNSSGSLIYLFFQWLITYFVVIFLGFESAGIFSLAIAISSVAFAFSLYGVRGYQVSDLSGKYSDKSYVLARIVTCSLSIIGVLIFLGFYGYDKYTTLCIIAYVLFKTTEAYADVYHGIIQKGMRMDYIGKSFMLRGILGGIAFVFVAVITKSLLLAICAQALISLVIILFYDRKNVNLFFIHKNEKSLKPTFFLLAECLPLALYVFLSNLIMSIPRISLENTKGSEILGIYASIAIPAAVIQIVAGYIFSPMLTVFAEHLDQKNYKSFNKLFFQTLVYILSISAIAIIGGIIIGKYGLILLFGEKISSYTYLFVPILFISSLTALSWFIGLMLTVVREFRGLILASVISVVICLLGSKPFIINFGLSGVNYILVLALTVQIIIMLFYLFQTLRRLEQ